MTKRFIVACLVLLFSSTSRGAAAADEGILELGELVKRVVAAHPAIKATEQEIATARAELLGSQGAFDPVLKGEYSGYPKGDYSGTYGNVFVEQPLEWYGARTVAGFRRGGGAFPIYEDYNATNSGGEARAGIEIPLLRDGPIDRRRASIARAFLQLEGANFSLRQRTVEVVRAAANSYWDWVAATRKMEAYRTLLDTAEQRDRQLGQRVSVGDLASIDKLDNERQVLQRRAQLVAAERSLRKAEFDLGLFLWSDDGAPVALGSKRPIPTTPTPPLIATTGKDAVDEALTYRAEHQRVDNALSQQEIELSFAENQLLPRIDVQALASDDLGTGSSSRDEAELKAGLKVEIPLATRTQRGRIDGIAAKKRELSANKRFIEERIAVEVADAINAFTLATSRLQLAREEVRIARELERGEQTRFAQGESNLIFVNLREQATADAMVREVDALADCWKSHVNYRAAIGNPDALF